MVGVQIDETGSSIQIIGAEKFNLEDTFECGQCFRWDKMGSKYHCVVHGFEIWVYYKGKNLVIEGDFPEKINDLWIEYFDLNLDYSKIRRDLSAIDPTLHKACKFCPGIRILRQEPWETLCSFIISQNNNIPRIKKIISRLCENFGNKIGEGSFSFPDAKTISELSERDLEVIKSGFRAKYIIDAANKVSSKEVDLEKVSSMDVCDARKYLMKIKGVGPKVAECTLLYGFHRMEAFPVDVWMRRVMERYFPGKTPEIFGKYAGLAQQYLFHYTRSLSKL